MFNVGDMVKKATNTALDKGIGIVIVAKEYVGREEHLYWVEWIETNQQYVYEAKELTLVSRVQ